MNALEMKVDAIARIILGGKSEEVKKSRQKLEAMLGSPVHPVNRIDIIVELLLELGAPSHLIGYEYTVYAIGLCVDDRSYINNITHGLYPQIASQFDTTPDRVERAIRHLIEVVWLNAPYKVIEKYFGNTINAEKGKATNRQFIAQLAVIVQQRMRLGM